MGGRWIQKLHTELRGRPGYIEARGYANSELDARIEAIEGELSTYARDGLIEAVWWQLLADVVVVPLYRLG